MVPFRGPDGCSSAARRPLASSMFAPGVPEVLGEFDSDNAQLGSLVVSVYVLGYAFGPLIIAPLSELYGRLVIYHSCNLLFVIFTIACAVSRNLNTLIGFRFLAGTFGSAPLTIGGGTIADMIVQEKRGGYMAIWALGPLMGPVIGPVAGGYISESLGWRWVFWIITITVQHLWWLETEATNWEETGWCHYGRRVLISTGKLSSDASEAESEKASQRNRGSEIYFETGHGTGAEGPVQTFHRTACQDADVFSNRVGLVGANGGRLRVFVPSVHHPDRRLPGELPLFAGNGRADVPGNRDWVSGGRFCVRNRQRSNHEKEISFGGNETGVPLTAHDPGLVCGTSWLWVSCWSFSIGDLTSVTTVFLYGWTAERRVFWIAPILGTGFGKPSACMMTDFLLTAYQWVLGFWRPSLVTPKNDQWMRRLTPSLQMPISTYLVDAFTLHAASALAANTVLRSLVGALLPLAGPKMYQSLGLGWGNSLLAFIALALCPIPVLFYKYGERIRTSPRFQVRFWRRKSKF